MGLLQHNQSIERLVLQKKMPKHIHFMTFRGTFEAFFGVFLNDKFDSFNKEVKARRPVRAARLLPLDVTRNS